MACRLQGVVAFFPSFAYADQAAQRWEATGALVALAARKRVFREPRAAAAVQATLAQYAESAQAGGAGCGGALMLCVVGGKLAEGINFGDGLGRCAVCASLHAQQDLSAAECLQSVTMLSCVCTSTHPEVHEQASVCVHAAFDQRRLFVHASVHIEPVVCEYVCMHSA